MARTKQTMRSCVYFHRPMTLAQRPTAADSSSAPPLLTKEVRYYERIVNRRCLNCNTAEIYKTVRAYKNHKRTVAHVKLQGTSPNSYSDGNLDELTKLHNENLFLHTAFTALQTGNSLLHFDNPNTVTLHESLFLELPEGAIKHLSSLT